MAISMGWLPGFVVSMTCNVNTNKLPLKAFKWATAYSPQLFALGFFDSSCLVIAEHKEAGHWVTKINQNQKSQLWYFFVWYFGLKTNNFAVFYDSFVYCWLWFWNARCKLTVKISHEKIYKKNTVKIMREVRFVEFLSQIILWSNRMADTKILYANIANGICAIGWEKKT